MGDLGKAAEIDIVAPCHAGKAVEGFTAQGLFVAEPALKFPDGCLCGRHQLEGQGIFIGSGLNLVEAVMQGVDEGTPPLGIIQEVLLDKGITGNYPEITQNLKEHPCRTARFPGVAQLVKYIPVILPEKANDNLPVGKRGVVVWYLANASGCRFCHYRGVGRVLDRGGLVAGSYIKEGK